VPNGVDAEKHAPSANGAKPASAAPPRLLLVGRLVHQKGADLLLRALGSIAHEPFTLEIVGDGPDREMLEALAKQEGIAERVRFCGWVERERIAEHYRAADVFVFPSRIEGMPNVVLEAMAYALPIVATDVPGNRELVVHERTGLVVRTEHVQQLASALERVLREAALRQRLGANARQHVLEHHTWTASAAAYLKLGGLPVPSEPSANGSGAMGGVR
jgi:glycosyltransferase involved in cell wall biosynthesis